MTRHGIILAGGASRRMGTAKQALRLDGVSLLQRTVDACLGVGGCERVAVVAPDDACGQWFAPDERVALTLEDPPLGGPVAGIVAGMAALGAGAGDEVLLLACDLPRVGDLVDVLAHQELHGRALVPVDDEGWPQYLAARYPAAALLAAVDAAGRTRDISVRRLLRGVEFTALTAHAELLGDVDSPDQARAAGIALQ